MRLFIAINFCEDTRERLTALREELRANSEYGSFTLPENLHLTLVFLGECLANQTALAKAAMDEIRVEPLDLKIERVGRFERDDGDIWWAGLGDCKPLLDLQRNLTDKLIAARFELDKRKFSPHITLARRVVTSATPKSIAPFGETVSRIELMKSERVSGKLTYTAIHSKRG